MNGTVRDLRDELLAQHAQLRRAAAEVRGAVHRVRDGDCDAAELRQALNTLARTLQAHCAHEDEVLGDLIRHVDAWGDARAEVLSGAHASEVRELDYAATAARTTDDLERLFTLTVACVERLLEQFAREERYVLAEDVLCDDIVPRNSFCG